MTEHTNVELLPAAPFSGEALAPHGTIPRVDGIERPNNDVMPGLALWLADVSAEAVLASLQPLERADDPAIPEPSPE